MFDLTEAFEWAKERVDGDTFIVVAVACLFVVYALRTVLKRVQAVRPEFLAGFNDWCLVGGVIGAVLGLALIEPSAAGAVAGLVVAVFVTGSYEYLTHGGQRLKGAAQDATGATVAPLVAVCVGLACVVGGCGGPYLDPADPVSVDEACRDVEAATEIAVLLTLQKEEAEPGVTGDIGFVLGLVEAALETNDQVSINEAVEAGLRLLARNDGDVVLYGRVIGRAMERARHRLSGLDLSAEDELYMEVGRRLTAAAVRGARLACAAWIEILAAERETDDGRRAAA